MASVDALRRQQPGAAGVGILTASSVGRTERPPHRAGAGATGVLQLHWSRWLNTQQRLLHKGEWTYVKADRAGPVKLGRSACVAERGWCGGT